MKVYAYPLIPFTLLLALGIVCNSYFTIPYFISFGLLLLLIGLLFYFNWKTKKNRKATSLFGITTYCLAFLLGLFLQNSHFEPQKNNHYSRFLESENSVKGIVVSNLKSSAKNTKHILKIEKINQKIASGKLLVYIEKDSTTEIIPGTEIICLATFLKPSGEQNPFQFNYAAYLENNNIFDQIFLKRSDYKVVNTQQNWDCFWFTFQKKLANSFAIHNWDNNTQSVVNALLLGQRKLLDEKTLTAYSDVGVIHILAISGLHVGILYIFLVWILKPIGTSKKARIIRFCITILVLWSFAFITGFSASVSRAVIMFSLFAFGKILNKQTNTYNILATSALLLLVYNPNLIFDIGFQMSYSAVLAIVSFNPYFKYFRISKNKIVSFFTDILAVSLAAQIGVLPISLYYFHQFSPLFLVANLVAIPLTTAILWLGLITLGLNFVFPKFSVLIGKLLQLLIHFMNESIAWFSNFTTFIFKNIPFTFILAFIFSVVVLFLLIALRKKTYAATVVFLSSILVFQLVYVGTKFYNYSKEETIIYASKQTLISYKKGTTIYAFSTNFNENRTALNQYKTGVFSNTIEENSLRNVYLFNRKKIIVVDSFAVYPNIKNVDCVILTENPKLNLNRLITELNPKVIVATSNTKFYLLTLWKSTCAKRKIPFHATAEKGFYTLE
ncbi:ComEC/Rec2 family competence protein [Flavobacterium sp.]|uniref:ComEC/Rec2 family competence protein n=1 Tax=Flavobacterium sp. TaxID=239 RepID=UPI00352952DA